jgi:pantetheine-phosphate adenylyltransferase
MPKRRAIYPGTFDPITNGHVDIIHRAVHLFDELVVAVAANPQKEPFLPLAEREQLVRQSVRKLRRVRITTFGGLLVDLARDLNAVAIVRGLRAVSDFELEFQMALANREMYAGSESVYLMPSAEHTFISSTIIKNIALHGGRVRRFVPAHVEQCLKRKLRELRLSSEGGGG